MLLKVYLKISSRRVYRETFPENLGLILFEASTLMYHMPDLQEFPFLFCVFFRFRHICDLGRTKAKQTKMCNPCGGKKKEPTWDEDGFPKPGMMSKSEKITWLNLPFFLSDFLFVGSSRIFSFVHFSFVSFFPWAFLSFHINS